MRYCLVKSISTVVTVIILSVFFFKPQFQSGVAVPLLKAQNEKSAQIIQIRVLHNNHVRSIVLTGPVHTRMLSLDSFTMSRTSLMICASARESTQCASRTSRACAQIMYYHRELIDCRQTWEYLIFSLDNDVKVKRVLNLPV